MVIEKINDENFIVKDIGNIIKDNISRFKFKDNILRIKQDIILREMIASDVITEFLSKQKIYTSSIIPITIIKIPLKEFIENGIITFKEDITITLAILTLENSEELFTYNILDTL